MTDTPSRNKEKRQPTMKKGEPINLRKCGMISIAAAMAPLGLAMLLLLFQDYNAARYYILCGIGAAGLFLGSGLIVGDTVRGYVREENAARQKYEQPPITIMEVIRGPYDPQIAMRNRENVARVAMTTAFGFAVSALVGIFLDVHIITTIVMLTFAVIGIVIGIIAGYAADLV